MRKRLDLILGISSLIIGLPAFFSLFFTPYESSAVMALILAVMLGAGAQVARIFLNQSPYTIKSVICWLRFTDQKHATISREFLIRPNFPHLTEIAFGRMSAGATGTLSNFRWDGVPIPPQYIQEEPKGTFTATVHFEDPPRWFSDLKGIFTFDSVDSYPASSEYQIFSVEHPTKLMEINIEFPAAKPCIPATVYATESLGAQPRRLESPEAPEPSGDGKTIKMVVKNGQLAGRYRVRWNW